MNFFFAICIQHHFQITQILDLTSRNINFMKQFIIHHRTPLLIQFWFNAVE